MTLKSSLKGLVGSLLSIDFLEKLTEYSIAANDPRVSLSRCEVVSAPGTSWTEVADGGRRKLWKKTFDKISAESVLLLEFGVFKGDSMREFATLHTSSASRFVGFDSFEGLPEIWRGTSREHFSVHGNLPDIQDTRVSFVKGWFNQTLPVNIDNIVKEANGRVPIVHFDADLYSSTLYLLFELGNHFDSYHFIFDEFSGHETRALYNYIQATGAKCEFYYQVKWQGDPTAVSGRITMPKPPSR